MKKIFFFLFLSVAFMTIQAQEKDTLSEYTGKYIFTEKDPVPEVDVTLADNALSMSSSAGNSSLIKLGVDSFQIVEFNGTAVFKRSTENEINAVHIEAMGYILDGQKQKNGLWSFTSYYRPANRELLIREE